MGTQKRNCRASGCSRNPYLGGLCDVHEQEEQQIKQRRASARAALDSGAIDGDIPTDLALRDELWRLRRQWYLACQVVRENRGTSLMPVNEAEFATEWCIALAQEIVEAHRALAAGKPMPTSVASTGGWVWERFRNLEAGLRSNGALRA
jgi:hypothetical protein